jgi:hypothetical protein
MNFYRMIFERFVSLRRVPLKMIVIAALASYVLQLSAILLGFPLYLIAIYTLLPWIPIIFFESVWKIEHYTAIAIFAIIAAVQVGHLSEHATQVVQATFLNGTAGQACPPPQDSPANATRAVELGLRDAASEPTGFFANAVIKPDASGQPTGIEGPPACGVIGAFDLETVHLVWDSLVWIGALWLLFRFPRNIWLWVSIIVASIHEIEHMFLGWIYFFDTAEIYSFTRQLWATVADGRLVTAIPAGQLQTVANFYDVTGFTGIAGGGGLLESLIFGTTEPQFMPNRLWLHFFYNCLVIVPTVIAFLVQVRKVYDEYLAKALPELTEEQLVAATTKLEHIKHPAGTNIIKQGDPPSKYYIITKGEVEVVKNGGQATEKVLTKLGSGQYFGEIELLQNVRAIATVRSTTDVELLAFDGRTFGNLMREAEASRDSVERMAEARRMETEAAGGGG